MTHPWSLFGSALLALATSLAPSLAQAKDSFPNRPIRFIVPYGAGGNTDVVARALGQKIQESTGQPVIIENRPGASETIGTAALAKAPADGYTIGLVSSTNSVNATVMADTMPYRNSDFAPITALVGAPMMVIVPNELPANSIEEFVALAKKSPGKLNYATFGPTSLHAISNAWFNHMAGISMTPVAYKGASEALIAVARNEVQFMFTGLAAGMAQVRGNKMKALGVSTAQPLAAAPELPPIDRSYPGYDVMPWYGVMAPAGVPRPVLDRLNAEIVKALKSDDIKQRFAALGVDPWPMTIDEFSEFLKKDVQVWAKMIKAAGNEVQK